MANILIYAIFWLVLNFAAAAALLVSPFPIYATHTAPSINLNLNIQNWKEKKLGRRSIHWKKITPPSPAYSLAIESSTQGGKLKSLSGKFFFSYHVYSFGYFFWKFFYFGTPLFTFFFIWFEYILGWGPKVPKVKVGVFWETSPGAPKKKIDVDFWSVGHPDKKLTFWAWLVFEKIPKN